MYALARGKEKKKERESTHLSVCKQTLIAIGVTYVSVYWKIKMEYIFIKWKVIIRELNKLKAENLVTNFLYV